MISSTKRIALTLLALLVGLAAVLIVRVALMDSRQPDVEAADLPAVARGAEERLAGAVQFETVSPTDYDVEELAPFEGLKTYLEREFPQVHRTLEVEDVPPCSRLYTWEGANPDRRPAVLMSHLDVVPVEDPDEWTHPPYSGKIADGYIWGRGTLDIKTGVVGILEAAETLIGAGIEPKRPVMFAFGCDEEVGGQKGAVKIVSMLEERDIEPAWILDEGHAITKGIVPGLDRPVGLVGLAEKGYVTFKLTATAKGGHSSMPPKQTAVGVLAKALARLEANPMPARLNAPTRKMFQTLGPELPVYQQLVFANLWLLEPVLIGQLRKQNTTDATIRTTTAVTKVRGGTRENVLPKKATASVNFRIAPGDTIADVRDHIERVVRDERVIVAKPDRAFASNPSPVSETDTPIFRRIRRVTRQVFGEKTIVAPALTVGGTDSRHYTDIADNIYRFIPMILGPKDTERIHGTDERIERENYRNIVRFYMGMLAMED